mgnify:CR=1 FL=1
MSDWTLCIDFGTAFSKAAVAPSGAWSRFDPATLRPLMLSAEGQNAFLLDSAVFVDEDRVLFGRAALNEADEQSRRLVTDLAEWSLEWSTQPLPYKAALWAAAHSDGVNWSRLMIRTAIDLRAGGPSGPGRDRAGSPTMTLRRLAASAPALAADACAARLATGPPCVDGPRCGSGSPIQRHACRPRRTRGSGTRRGPTSRSSRWPVTSPGDP